MERIYCDNERLICDVCLSNECRSCQECDLCPVLDIEVVVDWFAVVILGAMKASNSPIHGASEFPCPPESVDREVCCAGTFHINRC